MLHTLKNKISTKTWLFVICIALPVLASAQTENMLDQLDSGMAPTTDYTTATFKSTRVVNAQSVENLSEGVLDVRIDHRFGPVNDGFYGFYGLDAANTRFQFDYGIKNWLQVGIGRSSVPKSYGGNVKLKFLRQSTGKVNMPISLVYNLFTNVDALQYVGPRNNDFQYRLAYVHQLVLGRKFSENFSLELIPTLIHTNLTALSTQKNDQYAMGIAMRQKISKRVSINLEYFYLYPTLSLTDVFTNSLSLGMDIETGGHVFQIFLTNCLTMNENDVITDRAESWLKGGIHLGFNISRVFTTYKPKHKPI